MLAKEYPPSRLVISCPELGDFPYVVNLASTPPPPEKQIRVQCALGQLVSTTLRFMHYSKSATEFVFKLSDNRQTSFYKSNNQTTMKVNACQDVRVGQEVAVDVTFEPSRVGDFKENVEITSAVAGTYLFALHGTCTPPQRQGPIEIRPNQSTQIQFKNVFNENVAFNFAVDHGNFIIAKPTEVIQAKKTTAITVQYKAEDPTATVRGKLTITGQSAGDPAPVLWVYYLRGLKESEVEKNPASSAQWKKK